MIKFRGLGIACLITLFFTSLLKGQVAASKPTKTKADTVTKRSTVMTAEERVVRAAYQKLTMLNKAALLINSDVVKEPENDDLYLRFELRNFRVGPIGDSGCCSQ